MMFSLFKRSASDAARVGSNGSPRVALFIDHTARLGGGEIALLNLVQHLDPERYRPIVLLLSDGPLADKLRASGVETHVLGLSESVLDARKDTLGGKSLLRLKAVAGALAGVIRVAAFVRRAGPDVVHTNSLKADLIGGIAARLAGTRLVWHVRDRIDDDYLPRPIVHLFRFLCRLIPHVVIANSAATLDTLHLTPDARGEVVPSGVVFRPRGRGWNRSRDWVVHDGTDKRAFPTAEAAPARHGAVVSMVGRIARWKGQHVFLEAASIASREFPDARFRVIGGALFDEQDYQAEIRALAESLGLGDRVDFLGFRSDVPGLIHESDVIVHASITGEPFGQVVIEGMAAGKPVVATNGGGVPEIVIDGVTGVLVPMADPHAMAAALSRLLGDAELRRSMGQNGLARVREHFTIEHTATKVQAIYDGLLAAR